MWHMPTCIFHMLSIMPQNPRHTHTLDMRTHTRRGYQIGRAEPGLDPGRPKAQISTTLLLSTWSFPQQGRGQGAQGQARVRGVSVYCHIGVKINRKTGTSTEESHKLDFSRDATGNRNDSSFASRESPLPSLNPYLSHEGGAATNSSDEQAQPQRCRRNMRFQERPLLEWRSLSSL